ncbi:MAG: ice-binding family protein [Vicingaceae bacterium]
MQYHAEVLAIRLLPWMFFEVLVIFRFFAGADTVTDTATPCIVGNIGSNSCSISGFGSSIIVRSNHAADAISVQAKTCLDNAYNKLMLLPNTVSTHAPRFGFGETLTEGVYFISGSASLGGNITRHSKEPRCNICF